MIDYGSLNLKPYAMNKCPCYSEKLFSECCGPFLTHQKIASTPEELMRSRYTAYALADVEYIAGTMKSPALDDFDPNEASQWVKKIRWLKLEVKETKSAGDTGYVEYIAYYSENHKQHMMHELSEFKREDDKWYYVSGKILNNKMPHVKSMKIGRNETCPCGSGKKFKKCCYETK